MALGSLVAIPELQAEGPARLEGQQSGFLQLRFLASGAEMTAEAKNVVRYCLLPGTRVRATVGEREVEGRIDETPPTNAEGGLLRYGFEHAGGRTELVEDAIVRLPPAADPAEQLRSVAFHELQPRFAKAGTPLPPYPWGPSTFSAREELQRWRDEAWSRTGGVIGLAGSRVRPLPHQLLAARRILADRQIRFLLADEVGLGKTIEAGLVMQSLLAMNPSLRVLVVVPGALVSQWFVELYVKFGGRSFTMLDADRLAEERGNPWNRQFVIASTRALEELRGKDAIKFGAAKWDLVIIDECHRMHPGSVLYRHVERLSKRSPHVLLLSATPGRQHVDAYLALLHLLQPEAYRLDDVDGFAAKLAAADAVAELLIASREGGDRDALVARWVELLGDDQQLAQRLQAWRRDESAFEGLATFVREHYQLDHRVIRNRRQVLATLSRATGISGLDLAERTREWVDYQPDAAESTVRDALAAYRDALVARFGDADQPPPRLVHWLLQLELAAAAEPRLLDRLLAMRSAVLADPDEFAVYRARASKDETLAQVLRADLSDAETNAHIAISAAHHLDPAIEAPVLDALRAAVGAWMKRGAPARDRACERALDGFWDEFPAEKVLVFTTHAMAVEPLAERLRARFGDLAIATFGAHLDSPEREEAARRFAADERCHVLVCDPLGGEGRNFQFVSLVLHHDLPWSLAAVEQRIGRVDRLGRDGEVPSWILRCTDERAVDAAWAELLDQRVGVFSASSSGLEFVARELECRSAEVAATGGAAALRAIGDELGAAVERERDARDHLEDELMAASEAAFAEAAELARAVESARPPVDAVCRWLRGMGGGVRREDEPPAPFHLRGRSAEQPIAGVFDRELALRHEHLAFFGLGHQLIDACIDDAQAANWCTATAWRRQPGGGVERWEGLRVAYELGLDLAPLVAAELPLESLRRIFAVCPPRRVLRFVRLDGEEETDATVLARLGRGFDVRIDDATLSPKTSRETWMRPLLGGKLDQVVSWQRRVDAAVATAETLRAPLLEREREAALGALRPALEAQAQLAAIQHAGARHRLGDAHDDVDRLAEEAVQERLLVDALIKAVAGAELRMASLAYLVIG